MNEFGAIAGLVLGFVAGMAKLTIQTFFGKGKIDIPVLSQIGDFNAYYATGVLFLFSIVVIIFASKMRPAPASEKTTGLTYAWLLSDKQAKKEIEDSWDWSNKIFAGLIFLGVLGMYLYFSFWLS